MTRCTGVWLTMRHGKREHPRRNTWSAEPWPNPGRTRPT